ncbi:MAG: bifunctional folylpolyglutamate synthase/dihydrofolate synthase [Chloroflexi bacterium]|nr:bifunctional folylpolyglutamate synthase/dihydrofolate synthase [Chloroflexota bacterium]
MDYGEAIDYLLSLTDMERGYQASPNPTMSLASVRSLLSRLNDPHLGRQTVHVTGSKGKGSTSAMVANILQHSGEVTALFTSPHLHSFTERIAIDGDAISPEEFAAGIAAIHAAVEAERESVHGNVSTFGVLTALFFWLVRAQAKRVTWQVVEVGLGGTFDATNVFDAPDVVVITPISLEHTAILGDTTVAIATDKAGIIKAGSTCVLAAQRDPAVVDVVRARCAEVGAELIDVGAAYEIDVTEKHIFGQAFTVTRAAGTLELRSPMLGRHQAQNAATAVAVADALRARGHAISDRAIAAGIARTRVRGRLEVMGQHPLIVADGAHNPESAEALAKALREYFDWKRCFFVMGTTRDKDARGMGFKLAKLATMIILCGFDNPRAADPFATIQEVGFLGPPAVAENSVAEGIDTAMAYANEDDIICVTGSLYVVAEAREYLLGESAAPQA